ncbi:MAG: cytochrome c1 [Gammaproteobacteria bacterium]|nr:cytochrome c1 [Gammaproteobacteria bacterium]
MSLIKKWGILAVLVAGVAGVTVQANADTLMSPPAGYFNKPAVIAGAKLFAEHCSACHAVGSLRYERLASDLGMPKASIVKDVMLPNGANYRMGMQPAMTQAEAKKWFGLPPPDLSHMVRALGARFIYTYLQSFYWDPNRPSGWNNHVFPKVAMPNVLQPWSGIVAKDGKVMQPGRVTPAVFHQRVADIVAFLRYASDPSVFVRHKLGPYVLGLLAAFSLIAYWLKKEYWKDVHDDSSKRKK